MKWVLVYLNNSKRKGFGEVTRFVYYTRCRAAFKMIKIQSQTRQKESVPWWTDSLTIMRKRINTLRDYLSEQEIMRN